ncbi:MAG: uracil-DNA glycosylase [Fimbriimonadales bacterium]|nr:uracil-DNA glycosylase [Fimbriimonadales bacterium]
MPRRMESLNDRIVACRRCPRLRAWCEAVAREKRASFRDQTYWGLPVPNFGDPAAERLIVGLAPAAHGANRTGRMFTGDRSGDWLYRALHRAGVASQPESRFANDGLTLRGALITAVCHCAPPDNKPTNDEIAECRPFLREVLESREWRAILCLGSVAWRETLRLLGAKPLPPFSHLRVHRTGGAKVVASYHPSQQNTFTGRLTEQALDAAIAEWLV